MTSRQEPSILRFVRRIGKNQHEQQASDRELLSRFAEKRDEDAFSVLVRRHGSMVMSVGLRVLRHHQDAEDVCQATFLLLAKKAKTIAWRESIADWLYGVVHRLSLKVRQSARRRSAREAKVQPRTPPDALADINAQDLQTILDEELSRLASRYRTVLLLCCLEGKSRDEAARFLGLPLSTVISRLQRGRELLRQRLAARGVPLSLAVAGVTLLSETARAAVPAAMVRAFSEPAFQAAAGKAVADLVSTNVLALVKRGMYTMFFTKLKITMAGLLLAGLLISSLAVVGLGTLPHSSQAQQPAAQDNGEAAGKKPERGHVKLRFKLEGHGKGVTSVAFSPDGKLLASGSDDNSIIIWNTKTGDQVRTLTGEEPIREVVFSPDGKSLGSISLSAERPVKVWDVATGKEKVEIKEDNKEDNASVLGYSRCAFSPDGKVLAGTFGGTVRIWDTTTGKKLATITEKQLLRHLLFSPDSKVLVLGLAFPSKKEAPEGEDTIRLWDWAAQKPKGTLKTTTIPTDLHFSPDGKTLVSLGFTEAAGHSLTLWDFEKLQQRNMSGETWGHHFALLAGGTKVAVMHVAAPIIKKEEVVGGETRLYVHDIETGNLLETITLKDAKGGNAWGGSLAASRDGSMLAVGVAEKYRETYKTGAVLEPGTGIVRIWELRQPPAKEGK